MNKCVIVGNIAREPESRTTQGGVSVATFTVAVQREFRNANGTYDADFLPVVAWRQAADYVTRYLHKGSKVAVDGSIQTRSYDAQDGSKRYVTEIIANRVEGLDRRENNDSRPVSNGQQQPRQAAQQTTPPASDDFSEVDDDQLPFD